MVTCKITEQGFFVAMENTFAIFCAYVRILYIKRVYWGKKTLGQLIAGLSALNLFFTFKKHL